MEDIKFLPVKKVDYSNNVEIIPLHEVGKGNVIFQTYEKPKKKKKRLNKNKYDIEYVITLLKFILDQCEEMKMNPRELQFSLVHSLKKMIAMLEVEKDQQNL
jgi:hypothetical protein